MASITKQLDELMAQRLRGSLDAITSLRSQVSAIADAAAKVIETLRHGGTIYTAGNGGSAAEALHLAEELIGRYCADRPPQRSMCLNADPTALTCIANDYGFEQIFARQCEALGTADDLLVVFSTSGNSPNILAALDIAAAKGMTTIGLLGRGGGAAAKHCMHSIVVDADDSAHIQEAHQVILHMFCEAVDHEFSKR